MSRRLMRAAAVAGAIAAATVARAAPPDWALELARGLPPLDASSADARVLFSETRVTVERDGRMHTRRRIATQVLSRSLRSVDAGAIPIDGDVRIRRAHVWHVKADGEDLRRDDSWVEFASEGAFVTDKGVREYAVGDVKRGSLVIFEAESDETPTALVLRHPFADPFPSLRNRFVLELPEGWSVRAGWASALGPEPVVSGHTWTWEVRDVDPGPEEPLSESPIRKTPWLVVALEPKPGEASESPRFDDWTGLAVWYERLARGMDTVTPEIETRAAALAPDGTPFLDRVRSTALWVRDGVRYNGQWIGIGGYKPHPAAAVLHDAYGDCKDKVFLLRALLAAEGITSWPLLIDTRDFPTVHEAIADLAAFDHAVAAVVVPDGTTVPDSWAEVLVDGGPLGRLLIVDATSEGASPGTVPGALSGKRALVAAGAAGRLVTLPAATPETHVASWRLDAEFLPGGAMRVRVVEERRGTPAEIARAGARKDAARWRERFERRIREVWPETRISSHEIVAERPDGAFVESLVADVVPTAGPVASLALFPAALDDLPQVPLAKRKGAVVYDYPRTLRIETVVRGVPPAAAPAPTREENDAWAVATSYDAVDGSLRGVRQIVLVQPRFEPDRFDLLKKLWTARARAASIAVTPAR